MLRNPKKILFLGLGGAGQRHLRLFSKRLPKAKLISWRMTNKTPTLNDNFTVSKVSLEEMYGLKIFNDIAEAFDQKPDLAVISYPSAFHHEMIVECAKRGINIFIEKPGAINITQANSIKRIIKKYKVDFFISFQRSFHPLIEKMFHYIKNNKIGQIMSVRINVGSYVPEWHPYEDFYSLYACQTRLGGGVITTECHELDILLSLFGIPKNVYSTNNQRGKYKILADDSSTMLFEYKKFTASINLCFMQKKQERNISIIGQDGNVFVDLNEQSIVFDNYNEKIYFEKTHLSNDELFNIQLEYFLNEHPINSDVYIQRIIKLTKLFEKLYK